VFALLVAIERLESDRLPLSRRVKTGPCQLAGSRTIFVVDPIHPEFSGVAVYFGSYFPEVVCDRDDLRNESTVFVPSEHDFARRLSCTEVVNLISNA
jgi:hypothetical protein